VGAQLDSPRVAHLAFNLVGVAPKLKAEVAEQRSNRLMSETSFSTQAFFLRLVPANGGSARLEGGNETRAGVGADSDSTAHS
jgi:hypothetical protein